MAINMNQENFTDIRDCYNLNFWLKDRIQEAGDGTNDSGDGDADPVDEAMVTPVDDFGENEEGDDGEGSV